METQLGPTPYGSTTLRFAHGSPFKSMDQICHQVAHLGPTAQNMKPVLDDLYPGIPISDLVLHQFLVDLSWKGYSMILQQGYIVLLLHDF